MDDVEIAEIPLAHLLKPGPHTDQFWIRMFPKKLNEPLNRQEGEYEKRAIGWGIRINEELNWTIISPLMLFILIIIGIVVIAFAIVTSDNSSAFGLGGFLVATVYMVYQILIQREEE